MKQLSYSSLKKMATCEQKYWHHKVNETPTDPDADQNTEALDVGKALHAILEDTRHDYPGDAKLTAKVKEKCTEYGCEHAAVLVKAMAQKYYEHHEASCLDLIQAEAEISTPEFIGYIDGIFRSIDGFWWIFDLKTTSRWDEKLVPRLHRDLQLAFYKMNSERVAAYHRLDPKKFGGCIYRSVTKPKLVQKGKEETKDYLTRMTKSVKVIDVLIPDWAMDTHTAKEVFYSYYHRASELYQGRVPVRNYSACFDYFRPCEWFSRCHGQNYSSEPPSLVRVMEDYKLGGPIQAPPQPVGEEIL